MAETRVKPIKKFSGIIDCPPDKSITHRAVMFNSVAEGKSRVNGILLGEDCLATADCMRKMGAQVEISGDTAYITGTPNLRSAELYAGNSGTTMRLMCGLLASREGRWTISGDESLSRRPMKRVIDPITAMGGTIRSQGGKAPLEIEGENLQGMDYIMPVDSAQVKSAVILAGLGAQGVTNITEREYTRDHTEIMLAAMGADITRSGRTISVRGGGRLKACDITVAGDISSAAFPLVCGLITGGEVTVKNVGLNPTRAGLIEVFKSVGVRYGISDMRTVCGEKTGAVTVSGLGDAKPFKIGKDILPRLIDEIPVLAVLACFLSGESVIEDAHELRVKESDRIAATINLVRMFGGKAEETESGMVISPSGGLKGGVRFDSCGDHRMAMAAAVAAAASEHGAVIERSECVAVSYPGFWKLFGER